MNVILNFFCTCAVHKIIIHYYYYNYYKKFLLYLCYYYSRVQSDIAL